MLTSTQFDLPQGLLASVCFIESHHNTQAIHRNDGQGDSLGLCQIKLKTAKFLGFKGTAEQLMEPQINIWYAAKYLSKHYKKYGNIKKSLIAYNKGNAKGLIRSEYSDKVLTNWRKNINVNLSSKE